VYLRDQPELRQTRPTSTWSTAAVWQRYVASRAEQQDLHP
jgi:hypothetical protein